MGKDFDFMLILEFLPVLLSYLPITLFIMVSSIVLGLVFGLLAALTRLFRIPVLGQMTAVYVSYVRGTPLVIQLLLFYFGVPELLKPIGIDISRMSGLSFIVLIFGFCTGALFSEMIRAAVNAIDRGQLEAAYSVGMTPFASLRRIVLPQAVGIMLPNMANVIVGFLKGTSLAFSIGVMDMGGRGQALGAATSHFLETYIALSVIYYGVGIALEKGLGLLEKRSLRYESALPSA